VYVVSRVILVYIENDIRNKQRVCIKFCFQLGRSATETSESLQVAYIEQTVERTQVFDWFFQVQKQCDLC
jgi:hypothetical protein